MPPLLVPPPPLPVLPPPPLPVLPLLLADYRYVPPWSKSERDSALHPIPKAKVVSLLAGPKSSHLLSDYAGPIQATSGLLPRGSRRFVEPSDKSWSLTSIKSFRPFLRSWSITDKTLERLAHEFLKPRTSTGYWRAWRRPMTSCRDLPPNNNWSGREARSSLFAPLNTVRYAAMQS